MKIGKFNLLGLLYVLLIFLISGASIAALLFILAIEGFSNVPWEYYLIFGIGLLLFFMDIFMSIYLGWSVFPITYTFTEIVKPWLAYGCTLILIGSMMFVYHYGIHPYGIPREKLEKTIVNKPITAPKEDTDTSSTSTLPPILSIENIKFSEKVLDADETATLSIHIKNVGRGDARGLTIYLKSDFQGLSFPQITPVPPIPKKTGQQTVDIQVKGTSNLSTGKAKIEIYLEDPNFKQRIRGKQLTFDTRKPRTPDLVLADYAVLEMVSASPNNRIDVNEEIALKFYVQNKGTGTAEKVTVQVKNTQNGVKWLGEAPESNETGHITLTATFSQIDPGKHKLISNTFFVNSEFTDKKLRFTISAIEKHSKKYGFSKPIEVAINKKLKPLGEITPISIDHEAPLHENPRVEELPPLKSSGNTLWILLAIFVCCGLLFLIIWKRRSRGKQTKPSDSDQRQKDAYDAAAGRKERFK